MAMASKYSEQVKQGVESLINCLICTDHFDEPKVLPCQHTFCLPCLQHFYTSYNDSRIISVSNFPCPQCRKSVYMPQGGLESLPTDFKVGQIKDVFDKINIVSDQPLTCDVCRYDDRLMDVTSFCAQCSKYLCESCTEQHANSSLFRSHVTVLVGTQQTEDLICSVHKEVVKYFCSDCKIALCTVCALSKHSKHDTIDLATAMDRNRTKVSESVDVLKSNLVVYENKAETLAALIRGRQKHMDKLKESIKKHTRLTIAKLREEESKLFRDVDSISKRIELEIEKDISKMNVRAKEIKSVCDRTDAFLMNGGSLELVNKYESLIQTLREFIDPPDTKIEDHFLEELVLVPNETNTIGFLNTVMNESLADEEEAASPKKNCGENVLGKIRKLQKLANSNGSPQDKTTTTGSRAQSPDIVSAESTSVASSQKSSAKTSGEKVTAPATESNGESARVSADRPAEVTEQSRQEGIGATAEDPSSSKPKDKLRLQWKTVDNAESRDAAFLEDGTVVVTEHCDSSDKLQLFDPDGNLIDSVACTGQNIIKPWGCAVNHQSNQIIITDHGDRSVKVFDRDLSIRHVWRSLFEKPSGVAVMRTGEYVITDTAKPAFMVSVHTASGIRKREFANKGDGLEDLMQPSYVIADHSDRIIISDAGLNCIKIFDQRGKMLLKFQAANEPPLQPHGIEIDAHNNIIVADQSTNVISLFSSDGLFINNIAKLEEKPYGIAAHDNGSMAITTDSSLHMLYVPTIRTW